MIFRLALAFGLALTGCAYRTPDVHVPSALASAPPVSASDVTVVDAAAPIDDATADQVRADATKLLAHTGGVVHAQVVLEDRFDYANHALSEDGFAIFGLWPVALGMTYERAKIGVDVDVEANGRTFHGHGEAEKDGSLFAHARKRALAAALDRALADAGAPRP